MKAFILKEQTQVIAVIQAANNKELIERVEQAVLDYYDGEFEVETLPTFEAVSLDFQLITGRLNQIKLWLGISPIEFYGKESG